MKTSLQDETPTGRCQPAQACLPWGGTSLLPRPTSTQFGLISHLNRIQI